MTTAPAASRFLRPTAKVVCATVAASTVLSGLVAAMYALNAAPGPDAPSAAAVTASMVASVPAVAAAMLGVARTAKEIWRRAETLLTLLLYVATLASMAGLAVFLILGWLRIVGIQVLGSVPAVNSPLAGIGFAFAVAGILLFGWCVAPLSPKDESSDPHHNKKAVVLVLGFIFVAVPGLLSMVAAAEEGRQAKEASAKAAFNSVRTPGAGN